MKKPKEPFPTNEELSRSIDTLFTAAHQSALFAYCRLIHKPLLRKIEELEIPEAEIYFSNGVLESSLMLIRKTTEFFRPRNSDDKSDSLYAYLYLPQWEGTWVVEETIYKELHQRIGHITVHEARHGPRKWPILSMTIKAINQWVLFFRSVSESPVFQGKPPTTRLQGYVEVLQDISGHCERLQDRTTEL